MFDIEKMADELFLSVDGYVTALTADLGKRVHELDARLNSIPAGPKGETGDPGPAGLDGKDADPTMLNALVANQVSAAVAAIPKPSDGKGAYQLAVERGYGGTELQWLDAIKGDPGKNGKDADPEIIKAEIVRAVALLPASRDGKDADPALIHSAVAQQFEALATAFVQALTEG